MSTELSREEYEQALNWIQTLRPSDAPHFVVKTLQGLAASNDAVHTCGTSKRRRLKIYLDDAIESGLILPDDYGA